MDVPPIVEMEKEMKLDYGDTQLIITTCKHFGATKQQAAYILATAWHETNFTMKPVKEAYWLTEGWRKRNLRYYPWYGRGYVQLTWDYNYLKAGKDLGIDLTTDPDVVMKPEVSAKILVKGSLEGWFTGKSLKDYINSAKTDYTSARRVINGTDKASAIATYAKAYENALVDYENKIDVAAEIIAALKNIITKYEGK